MGRMRTIGAGVMGTSMRLGVASAVAIVLLAALAASSARASYPGANGAIAFEITRSTGEGGIYTIRPTGSDQRRLTGPKASEPSWSPDGQRIAFVRDVNGHGQIFTMGPGGAGRTRVTHGSWDLRSPAFSPSGNRIVFSGASPSASSRSIFTIGVDGTDRRRLVAGGHVDDPSYSVHGRIVFAGYPAGGSPPAGIWTAWGDGSHLRRLTSNPDVYDEFPDWSPDGARIVALRCNTDLDRYGECAGPAILMDADGSNKTWLYGSAAVWGGASFAPSGTRVALDRYDPFYIDECGEVYTIPLSGSRAGRRPVVDTCADGTFTYPKHPAWRPLPGG